MPRTKAGFKFCRALFRGKQPVIRPDRIGGGAWPWYNVGTPYTKTWQKAQKIIKAVAKGAGIKIMWSK
jgi:hypothetical protein